MTVKCHCAPPRHCERSVAIQCLRRLSCWIAASQAPRDDGSSVIASGAWQSSVRANSVAGSPRRRLLAMTVWDARNDERARGPFLLWSALVDGLDHRQLLVFHPHPIDHIAIGLRIHHQLIRCTVAVCARAHHQRPHDRVPSTPPNRHPAQRKEDA